MRFSEQLLPGELHITAGKLLDTFRDHRVFAFHGPMGAGKTTFIKSICKLLGVTDATSSPTFALVNEYHTDNHDPVFHFDFYRVRSEAEAFDIGFEEYVYSNFYCFIEWPEKIPNLLPEETIHVYIRVGDNEQRTVEVE